MRTITQKMNDYKRATIKGFKPFVESGLLTAQEVEFIANGSVVTWLDQLSRCEERKK